MLRVDLYKLQNDGTQKLILTCKLINESVVCEGDVKLISYLENKGIRDYSAKSDKKLYFKDGELFLKQMKYNFSSGYLNATDIIEES